MKLSNKILKAIYEGINNALLSFDDDDLQFNKSNGQSVVNNTNNEISQVLSQKILDILQQNVNNTDKAVGLTLEKYEQILDLYNTYGAKLILPNGPEGHKILKDIAGQVNQLLYKNKGDRKFKSHSIYKCADFRWIDTRNMSDLSDIFSHGWYNSINIDGWNTSNVTDFSNMFGYNERLNNIIGIENIDTSNALNFTEMFMYCGTSKLSMDLSKWDTSNVKLFRQMFYSYQGTSLGNLSNWRFDNIEELFPSQYKDFFKYTDEILDISMFYHAEKLKYIGDISNWNIINKHVKMDEFFLGCHSLKNVGDLSKWANNKFVSANYMFADCAIISDISNWTLDNILGIGYDFRYSDVANMKYGKYLIINGKTRNPRKNWPPLSIKAFKELREKNKGNKK